MKNEHTFAAMGKPHNGCEQVNGKDEHSSNESVDGPLVRSGNKNADLELGIPTS